LRFSLEKKLVLIYLLVVILLTGVLGIVLTNAYRTELMNVRLADLEQCANDVTYLINAGILNYPDSLAMNYGLSTLVQNYNAVLQLLDTNGNILYEITADGMLKGGTQKNLDDAAMNILRGGNNYIKTGYYNDYYDAVMVTLAVPILSNENNGEMRCVVYLSSGMTSINESYYRILSKLWLPIFSSVIIGIVLVSFLTYRVTMPLKEMSIASRQIAKGNFDKVLDIHSNDEIGDLAQSYNTMAKELAKSEKMKRDFVANITHELRSPITSISGFVEGMLDGTISQDDYNHYLNIVSVETRRLSKLIQEMLDLSRVESGVFPLNKTAFDINELIRRVVLKFSQKLDEKHLDLDIVLPEEKTLVFADPDRIEQVVQNLFDNALKFTPDGKLIRIYTEVSADTVSVFVADEGQGIDETDLPYIWDRFYTVDKARTSSKNGTGLGLPIVKKILEQHDQTITITSQLGKGSVFTFTLELYKNNKKEYGL